MEHPASFDPAVLATHVGFVRRLARALVHGADRADDVAADALAAAVSQRPETGASFRGWLRRVIARLARRAIEADERRRAREQAAAPSEQTTAVPGGDELAARLELERVLASAVAALEEPTRSTLFRRYWLDRTPSEIASDTGTPLATVKSRLARGLEQLRKRLDDEHGGRREEWLGALASSTSIGGTTVMAAKSKLAGIAVVAALALVTGGIVLSTKLHRVESGESTVPAVPASLDRETAAAASAGAVERGDEPTTDVRRTVDPATLPFAAGVVVDEAGRPIAGVRVLATRLLAMNTREGPELCEWPMELDGATLDARAVARSDASGRFVVPRQEAPVGSLRFAMEGFGLEVVRDFSAAASENQDLRVTLRPARPVRGRVLDTDGNGLDLASIWVLDADFAASSPPRNRIARHVPGTPEFVAAPDRLLHKERCDETGEFALLCVPGEAFEAVARAPGYGAVTASAAELPDPWEPVLVRSDLVLDVIDAATGDPVLDACAIVVARASGIVQDAAHPIVEQAERPDLVGLFPARVPGRSTVSVSYPKGGLTWLLIAPDQTVDARIHVAAIGYHSTTVDTAITAKVEPPHLRVELEPDLDRLGTSSIEGRVVGAPDAEVALYAVQRAVHGIDPTELLRTQPHLLARCDPVGRFAFPELPPADYLLLARAPTAAPVRADVTAPRRDLELTLTTAVTLEVVVVAEDGTPIEHAFVLAQDDAGRSAWTAMTEEQGIARFTKLPGGRFRVLAVSQQGEAVRVATKRTSAVTPLDPALFTPQETVEASLAPTGASSRIVLRPVERRTVRFLSRHDDGSPASSARFEYGSQRGVGQLLRGEDDRLRKLRLRADLRGEATVSLFPGEYWFIADEGHGRESVKVVVARDGDATATFVLPDLRPSGVLRGRVVDVASAEPIAGRDVKLVAKRPGGKATTVATRTTDEHGSFLFDSAPEGDVLLEIQGDRIGNARGDGVPDPTSPYGSAEHDAVVVRGEETLAQIELPRLRAEVTQPTIHVDVQVKDAETGSPLPRASVHVVALRGTTRLSVGTAATDAAGHARLDVFAAPKYVVFALGEDDASTQRPRHRIEEVAIEPRDGTLTVHFELRRTD